MNSCIILAAGLSSRLKSEVPKQYTILKDEQLVLDYSINNFKSNQYIDEIILICSDEWLDFNKLRYNDLKIFVGGKTRSESSYIGLKNCNNKCKNVIIHDAARPFCSTQIINNCFSYLNDYDAVIPILSLVDSVIDLQNNTINYLNRNKIKLMQTPQGFNYKKILNAYNKTKNLNYKDDLSLLLKYDNLIKYHFIDGESKNFKITIKDDLELAKNYLNEK